MSQYNISPKHFNPLFWELKKHLNNPKVRQIIIYGGTSAAKTYTISQTLLIDGYNHEYNSAVFKKESTTIDSYVYNDFKTIRDRFKLHSRYTYLRRIIRYKKNEIRFFGLDDPEKAKGISSYKKIYCNELSKFDEADYDELLDRMRGMKGQQLICDFNPIKETHWIKKKIFDSEDFTLLENKHLHPTSSIKTNAKGDIVIIKTTYLDNYWVVGSPCKTYGYIDQHVIDRYNKLMVTDYNRYKVTALGEWGSEMTEMRYYSGFRNEVHIKPQQMDFGKIFILSFDFNVVPYQTCLVIQIDIQEQKKTFKVVKELCLSQPLNNTIAMSRELAKILAGTKLPVFIYGDYSGANRHGFGMEYNGQLIDNHYEIIESIIKGSGISIHNFIEPNENTLDRLWFFNALANGEMDNISFEVDASCTNTIEDLMYCTYDKDGKKLKRIVKNKHTGESYQERGHCSDALEYALCGIFKNEFAVFKRGLRK